MPLRTILGQPGSSTSSGTITLGSPAILTLVPGTTVVNSLQIDAAPTGVNPDLKGVGLDAIVGIDFKTKAGLAFRLVDIAAIANALQYAGTATGSDPTLSVVGDANRGLVIRPAGTGVVTVPNALIGSTTVTTAATGGYPYATVVAGNPTGVPVVQPGYAAFVIDTTNNRLLFYSGGAWNPMGGVSRTSATFSGGSTNTSTTLVSSAHGVSMAPARSGDVLLNASVTAGSNTDGAGGSLQWFYNTTGIPVAGIVASTDTAAGLPMTVTSASNNTNETASVVARVTGLTLGTTYFFYLAFITVGGFTFSLGNGVMVAQES